MRGQDGLQWSGFSTNVYSCLMNTVPGIGPDQDQAFTKSKWMIVALI